MASKTTVAKRRNDNMKKRVIDFVANPPEGWMELSRKQKRKSLVSTLKINENYLGVLISQEKPLRVAFGLDAPTAKVASTPVHRHVTATVPDVKLVKSPLNRVIDSLDTLNIEDLREVLSKAREKILTRLDTIRSEVSAS